MPSRRLFPSAVPSWLSTLVLVLVVLASAGMLAWVSPFVGGGADEGGVVSAAGGGEVRGSVGVSGVWVEASAARWEAVAEAWSDRVVSRYPDVERFEVLRRLERERDGWPVAADEDLEPAPAPEPQPEPTPEPQPEPTPEPQPEPAPEPQPEPAPEPQPEPEPAAEFVAPTLVATEAVSCEQTGDNEAYGTWAHTYSGGENWSHPPNHPDFSGSGNTVYESWILTGGGAGFEAHVWDTVNNQPVTIHIPFGEGLAPNWQVWPDGGCDVWVE